MLGTFFFHADTPVVISIPKVVRFFVAFQRTKADTELKYPTSATGIINTKKTSFFGSYYFDEIIFKSG